MQSSWRLAILQYTMMLCARKRNDLSLFRSLSFVVCVCCLLVRYPFLYGFHCLVEGLFLYAALYKCFLRKKCCINFLLRGRKKSIELYLSVDLFPSRFVTVYCRYSPFAIRYFSFERKSNIVVVLFAFLIRDYIRWFIFLFRYEHWYIIIFRWSCTMNLARHF